MSSSRAAAALEERGLETVYIHCSGDPESLDGVIAPAIRTAIVDGTAPHVLEPRYALAHERYVDLSLRGRCATLTLFISPLAAADGLTAAALKKEDQSGSLLPCSHAISIAPAERPTVPLLSHFVKIIKKAAPVNLIEHTPPARRNQWHPLI